MLIQTKVDSTPSPKFTSWPNTVIAMQSGGGRIDLAMQFVERSVNLDE